MIGKGREVGNYLVEHAIVHEVDHRTAPQRKNEPLLNAAFQAAEYHGYAEAGHLLLGGSRLGAVAGGLSSAGAWVTAGLGYAWALSKMPGILYGGSYDSYSYRNRDPEPPGYMRARLRSTSNNTSNYSRISSTARNNHSGYSGFLSSQFKSFSSLGYGNGYAPRQFHSVLKSTGLINSYKNTHPGSRLESRGRRGEIGGVASSVGRIEGLKDSATDVLFDEHIFCVPTPDGQLPFSDNQLKQIIRELSAGIYIHETYPFFSLHFNNNSSMYPVLHPIYQNTLVGEVIGFLDYFMKGYLNGGIFDRDFLKTWSNNPNLDHDFLKSKLYDLKKAFKQNKLGYTSLREKMTAAGLDSGSDGAGDKFRTSFRIIAKQNDIQQHENIFVMSPDFDVFYTIDVMPDYQEYLDQYMRDNGSFPREYLKLRQIYEKECEDIKHQMPKLPLFREYFQMLGVINFFCYYLSTLKDMGKEPDLAEVDLSVISPFPNVMPPIPVRYYKHYPVNLSVGEILNNFVTQDKAKFNAYLRAGVDNLKTEFTPKLESDLQLFLHQYFLTMLPQQVREEEAYSEMISALQKSYKFILKSQLASVREECDAALRDIVKKFELNADLDSQSTITDKISAVRQAARSELNENIKLLDGQVVDDATNEKLEQSKQASICQRIAAINAQIQPAITAVIASNAAKRDAAVAVHCQEIEKARVSNIASLANQWDALHHRHKKLKAVADMYAQSIANCNASFDNARAAEIQSINQQTENFNIAGIARINEQAAALREKITSELSNSYHSISLNYDYVCKRVSLLETNLENISDLIARNEGLNSANMLESLQLSTMDISDNNFYAEAGDNHKIVGGCGMKLPNIKRTPFMHGDQLSAALSSQFVSQAAETQNTVNCNGKIYSVFKLKTSLSPAYTLVDHAEMAGQSNQAAPEMGDNEFSALSELSYERFTGDPVTLLPFNPLAVDKSGQAVIHYLAVFGSTLQMDKVVQVNPACLNLSDSHGNQPIHAAAVAGNVEAVNYLISKNHDLIHAKNNNGATSLLLAAEEGQTTVVQTLLSAGADVNDTLPNGLHALYLAIQNGYDDTASTLIQNSSGINVNAILDNGDTALHLAIEMNRPAVAKALINAGASPLIKRKSDGLTPFHCAAENGLTDVCQAIIAGGEVTVNLPLASGNTAMHLAAKNGHVETLRWLTETVNANTNAKNSVGDTPIMTALQFGQFDSSLYLSSKCEVNVVNNQNQNVCIQAALCGQFEVADEMIRRGEIPSQMDKNQHSYIYYLLRSGQYHRYKALNPDTSLSFDSLSSLDVAAQYGHKELIDLLVDKKSPYVLDKTTGWDLIHFAVKADHVGFLMKWLRENSGSLAHPVTHGKDEGKSLAYIAAENGSVQCLKVLMKSIAPHELKNAHKSRYLLNAAASSGKKKVLDIVLKKCNDINVTVDGEDNTIAHVAARHGIIRFIQHATTCGIDLLSRNQSGHTCLHIAILNDDAYLLKKILKLIPIEKRPNDLLLFAKEAKKQSCMKALSTKNNASEQIDQPTTIVTQQSDRSSFEPATFTVSTINSLDQIKSQILETIVDVDEDKFKSLIAKFPINNELLSFANTELPLLQIAFILKSEWAIRLLLQQGADPLCKDINGLNIFHHIAKSRKSSITPQIELAGKYMSAYKETLLHDESNNGSSVLFVAAINGNLEYFNKFIPGGITNYKTSNGNSLLHEAAMTDQIQLMKLLIEKRIDVNGVNKQKITPLMFAANIGNNQMIRLLLDNGADENRKDIHQDTALNYAIQAAHQDCALHLIPLMKNVSSRNNDSNTSFILAASKGMVPVMDSILMVDSNCHQYNKSGLSALHVAAIHGHVNAIQYLLANGFDINTLSKPKKHCLAVTPLHMAARQGNINTCEVMISLGARISSDEAASDLVRYLIASKNPGIFKLLNILNIEIKPQHLLISAGSDNIGMMSQLLLIGLDINTQNENGSNALHISSLQKSDRAAALLIDQGINLDAVTIKGNTALHSAASTGAMNIVRQLCAQKVALDKKNNDGKTALFLACEGGHYSTVLQLLKSGVKIDIIDNNGLMPAQVAAGHGHIEIAKLLSVFGDHSLIWQRIESLPMHIRLAIERYKAQVEEIDASIHDVETRKSSPIHHAILLNKIDALHILCEQKPDFINSLNIRHDSALHYAVRNQHLDAVAILLQHQADTSVLSKDNEFPIQTAYRLKNSSIGQLLVDNMVLIPANLKNNWYAGYSNIISELRNYYSKKYDHSYAAGLWKNAYHDANLCILSRIANYSTYYKRGHANMKLKNNSAAKNDYEMAIQLVPLAEKYVAFYQYGMGLSNMGDIPASIDAYLEVNKLNKYYGHAYSRLGELYGVQKDYAKSVSFFTEACRLMPSDDTVAQQLIDARKFLAEMKVEISAASVLVSPATLFSVKPVANAGVGLAQLVASAKAGNIEVIQTALSNSDDIHANDAGYH